MYDGEECWTSYTVIIYNPIASALTLLKGVSKQDSQLYNVTNSSTKGLLGTQGDIVG